MVQVLYIFRLYAKKNELQAEIKSPLIEQEAPDIAMDKLTEKEYEDTFKGSK